MTACLSCTKPLTHEQMMRHRKYCSRACGGTSRRTPRKDVTCPCGVTFQVPANSEQGYCTKSHAARYRVRMKKAAM